MIYVLSNNNPTDQGDEMEGGRVLERLEREDMKLIILCLSPTCETCRFTVPPAVALLNY
jgi:hypothetical protein